jgi:hypothetical protein
LLVGAVRDAVLADLILFLASPVHGPKHAGGIEVHSALPEDALDEVEELVLRFRGSFVEAFKEAFGTAVGDATHGALNQFATRFAREADAVLAGFVGSTSATGAAAIVGAALFAVAIGSADDFALSALALVVVGAGAALRTATVWSTLLAGAVGLTAATTFVAEFDANSVPLHFTAEGILSADARFAFTAPACGEWGGFTAAGAFAAVIGAVGTCFSLVRFTDAIAANGIGDTDAEIGAVVTVVAEAALVAAAIGSALLTDALRLADILTEAVIADVARFANATLSVAAVGAALHAIAFRQADGDALAIDTFAGISAVAAGTAATVGATLLTVARGGAGDAGEV